MEARMACGLATCQTRSCGRMTSWSRSTPLVSTCWMPKSETESSNSFCRIASRSFWAMRWLGSSGGKLISISGPPDPEFAKDRGLSWIVRLAMRLLSYRIRNKAKRHHVSYSFLFMRASGDQLREIVSLIESGIIRTVMDRVFPFESTKEALAYVETGRAKGKVVVKVR